MKLNQILPVTAIFTLFILSCAPKEKSTFSEQVWQKEVAQTQTQDLYAPHKNKDRFFAPWMEMNDKSFLDVLYWKLFVKTTYTQEEESFLPRQLPETAQRLRKTTGDFILWIGHNSFLIRIDGQYWLTDPIFSKRALLPARLTDPALTLEELNNIAVQPNILISHNHYDHLDRASMKRLPKQSRVFVPLGLRDYVKKMNKPQTLEMDWWQEMDLGNGIRLVCLPTQHWSMRINQGRNKSLWAAWLLITPKLTLYFGGDSGYFKGFKEVGKKYPGIDYAFMATTAYHPRWFMYYQHMNIPEAVKAFNDLGARYFIPTQWGTFHLGSEPAGFPGLDLARYIQDNNLDANKYKIMDIGEILPIGS
ncbi:MAG: MBL fold metallo-hydrolase [Desulfobacterales bacterium]|nr:MBL fold metallo-hydrolase [Desulfobacterales bacterium]